MLCINSLILIVLNINAFIFLFFWTFFSSDKFERVILTLFIALILANEDHNLARWKIANQLLLSHLKDQLDQVIALLLHVFGYFVTYNTAN